MRNVNSGPATPVPSEAAAPRSPENDPLLPGQGNAGTTPREPSGTASTISARQAGTYATTKSVGQIAVGTALITQVSWAASAGCFEGLGLAGQCLRVSVKLPLCLSMTSAAALQCSTCCLTMCSTGGIASALCSSS